MSLEKGEWTVAVGLALYVRLWFVVGMVRFRMWSTLIRFWLMSLAFLNCLASGCTVLDEVGRSVVSETKYRTSNYLISRRIERMARKTWKTYTASYPELRGSEDFGRGFRNGFYRYVKTGCEAAPPLPPSHYLSASFVSPEGKDAIADWFNGFHIGVIIAQQSGCRDLVQLDSPIAIDSSASVQEPDSLEEERTPQDAISPEAEPDR